MRGDGSIGVSFSHGCPSVPWENAARIKNPLVNPAQHCSSTGYQVCDLSQEVNEVEIEYMLAVPWTKAYGFVSISVHPEVFYSSDTTTICQ